MKTISIPSTMAVLFAAAAAAAQGPAASAEHRTMAPDDIQWGDAPPVFEKGARFAVLYGDPSKEGLFIVRLKVPAGYKIAPHTHPTDENVTVVSGSFAVGMGDKLDPSARAMPAGTFFSMPAQMHHFAIAKQESIVEVSAMGPFVIHYLNPADDPSKPRRQGRPAPVDRRGRDGDVRAQAVPPGSAAHRMQVALE